jgi:LCP family protein required for cell wall assembly
VSNRPPDEPEFDWLYGQKKPVAPEPDEGVEQTRVISSTRGSRVNPPPRTAPATPPPPTGGGAGGGKGGGIGKPPLPGRPKFWRNLFRLKVILTVIPLLLIAWIVFLVVVPIRAWNNVSKVNAFPTAGRPADQPGSTYLIVGSDSRKGLTKQQLRQYGAGGVGDVGQRTDTIMLLHLGDGKPLLLSIPRDSLVPVPGHGTTKINAAFAYGGAKLLIKTIEQDTGVKVDHYVEIGFAGLVKAVDAVDGVKICPTKRMVDRRANLRIKKGCQTVDGVTALAYSRSRHVQTLGDITRAQHQREVVGALGDKVLEPMTFINPWRYSSVVNAGAETLKVDEDTSVFDIAKFAKAMTAVSGKGGLTCSMPIRDLAVHWDHARALKLMNLIKTDQTDKITKNLCLPTGLPS